MSRRVVLFIALITLALLAAASAPWTLSSGGLTAAVSAHLRGRYGIDLRVNGRTTFALLPTPRVKFEDVSIVLPHQTLEAKGGTLRGELRILPLFLGRIELSEVALHDMRITTSAHILRNLDWARIFKDRIGETHARRLVIASSTVSWRDLEGEDLGDVNALVNWDGAGAPLYAVASASWRGERVNIEQASFRPVRLASDQPTDVTLAVSADSVQLNLQGQAQLGDDPRFSGKSLLKTPSMRDLVRWSGISLPFGPLMQALSVEGDLSFNHRRLAWPSVAVTLGSDKLEGTLAVRLDAERPIVTGTLAAEELDLSDFVRPFIQARTAWGSWSGETIDMRRVTGNDLDLRLSATKASFHHLHLGDMAASILVRPGHVEASLGRAQFHEGTLKGRLSLVEKDGVLDAKTQGSFHGVNIASFLSEIGQSRWITGQAQGQFAFEGTGTTPAQLMRQTQGHSAITVKQGELVGIALDDALRRVEKRPLSASLSWKGGRTPFDETQVQLTVKDGVGELRESRLSAPTLSTRLNGRISLAERAVDMTAEVAPVAPSAAISPSIVFEVTGGWDDISITPDVRSLIERSGAARPLFGEESAPLATAQ